MSSHTAATQRRLSLADPYLKTSRAKEHLDSLHSEILSFAESKPCAVKGEDDLKDGWYKIRITMKQPPDRMALIVGDLFYCLRSALDQTVWALAKLTLPCPVRTQFPIQDANNAESRKTFINQTLGVPPEAIRIIEDLQPYHGGDTAAIRSHLLWCLNAMCNLDKHRRIPVHGSIFTLENVVRGPIPPEVASAITVQAFDNGAEVIIPIEFKDKVNLKPPASFDIVFGDLSLGIECKFDGIRARYDFVADDVVPRFSRFFE